MAQTGENSDFNQLGNASPNSLTPPGADSRQSAQFICDSQRLISANLACDGYKNCQGECWGIFSMWATFVSLSRTFKLSPQLSLDFRELESSKVS